MAGPKLRGSGAALPELELGLRGRSWRRSVGKVMAAVGAGTRGCLRRARVLHAGRFGYGGWRCWCCRCFSWEQERVSW